MSSFRFQCPECRKAEADLAAVSEHGWDCPQCGERWGAEAGVVRGLTRESRRRHAGFFEERRAVREADYASAAPPDNLELPFRRGAGPDEGRWRLRAKTFQYFERKILEPIERAAGRPLSIVDLGAGVGWLSYRLALRGHRPVAVDLLDDPVEGLGAASGYPREFPRLQGELDLAPLADEQFDLAVFNDSFHCAADYRAALREARRLLGWGGQVVVLDTPVYQTYVDGEREREACQERFERKYGFPTRSILSMEYLDEQMIQALGRDLNIRWSRHKPWYGLQRHLRPLRAKLAGRRPPARFEILVGSWAGG